MVRACRLVVDTGNIDIISQFKIRYTSGIHAFGWSKEEAIDYMVKNTAMPRNSIEAEVLRYITIPGQALTYTIGEMKILELRKNAEIALGSTFDLKEFHRTILYCPGPLHILETCIKIWIGEKLPTLKNKDKK